MQVFPRKLEDLLKACYARRSTLFCENRMVSFAGPREGGGGDDDDTGTEGQTGADGTTTPAEGEEQAGGGLQGLEEQETMEVDAAPVINNDDFSILYEAHNRMISVMEQKGYSLPPDLDPKRLAEMKQVAESSALAAENVEKQTNRDIQAFLSANVPIRPDQAEQLDEAAHQIVNGLVEDIRGLSYKNLDSDTCDADEFLDSNFTRNMQHKIIAAIKPLSPRPIPMNVMNDFVMKLVNRMQEMAQHEWELIKTMRTAEETLWNMRDHMQQRQVKERLKKSAEAVVGFPLDKTQEIQGTDFNANFSGRSKGKMVDDIPTVWSIQDVYVNEERIEDPEAITKKQQPMKMNGVWIAFKNKRNGKIERMPLTRFRDFVALHDCKPRARNLKEAADAVTYLKDIGLSLTGDIRVGTELEFDEMVREEGTNNLIRKPYKVKIVELDDNHVKFDKEVLHRTKNSHPDVKDDEYLGEMSLPDFTRWLNKKNALPVMSFEQFNEKVEAHYEYMNKEYERNENCHRPISLVKGEILYADANGSPLYKIEDVNPERGTVKIWNWKELTYPEFLRWIYKYDIEPYDPELQAEKQHHYVGLPKGEKAKAIKRAEDTIDHFNKTKIWRGTYDDFVKHKEENPDDRTPYITPDEDITARRPSHSRWRQFLNGTKFLSMNDLYHMFNTGTEYYKRNFERRRKGRFSAIGKGIPWFGSEFERINQAAENDEVNEFQQSIEQWGNWQIEEHLYSTRCNQDQAKACLNVLATKGMIRWDDPRLWESINRFTDLYNKIPPPIPTNDSYQPYKEGTKDGMGRSIAGKTGMDLLNGALDSLWGEGTYISWKRQADGAIESSVQESYQKGEELESDPKNMGGIEEELRLMMQKHMNDEYVDPTEFEGYLRFTIHQGKANPQAKIYYLLMGFAAENSNGRTIMGWERMGKFISQFGNRFPALDYFTDPNAKRNPSDKRALIDNRKFIKSDFKKYTDAWKNEAKSQGDPTKQYVPPPEVKKFFWNETLTGDAFQDRLEKGILNTRDMDHDDSQFFIPALKESAIDDICQNTGAQASKFSTVAFKNMYLGFGMRVKALENKFYEEKELGKETGYDLSNKYMARMITSFRSFVRFDSLLEDRYKRGKSYTRMGEDDYRSVSAFDATTPVSAYQQEMQGLTKKIIEKYNMQGDETMYTLPFEKITGTQIDKEAAKKQKDVENAIENFGEKFYKMVMSDGGKEFLKVVNEHKFKSEEVFVGEGSLDLKDRLQIQSKLGITEQVSSEESE